jgi:hypothetical protein
LNFWLLLPYFVAGGFGVGCNNMRPQKITFGEMRSGGGPTGIIVYCSDYRCSHSIMLSADQWADDIRLSDVEPRFICKACGKRGADVRPNFEPARMGTG